jgi:EAL domain-containing protein (putative c-di-GMP-specific phosphodiesterase class I)
VLLQDTETTRAILSQLRDRGVKVSLDDFGTGYSSLSYLHSFPLDKVKIDRSFLTAVGQSKRGLPLLRNVARLNAELGMSVTMEGVETAEQLELITREGNFDEAQGFLFSPAVRPAEIEAMLDPASLRQLLHEPSRKVA